jgi:CubicO group peptidase (beta-lactamase class C family)
MKSSIVLAVILLLQPLVGIMPAKQASQVEARIKRVENGLLPNVRIKGAPGWSIQERLKNYKIPGVTVAVINDFKVDWAKSYGIKDIETSEPVTTATLFQAGSISKPVAAMVALKKVSEGKISLDENINDKLTTWKLPDNQFTANRKVTLADLLSHTGGLTVHGFPGYAPNVKIPTLPQVLDGAPPANTAPVRVDMEPGTKFRYSGGGITIAQLAIMDIEKKPYPQIARETVLGPLGMSSSTYEQPLPDATRKKAASGHLQDGRLVDGKIHIYPEMAAAGLWTTPTDLAKFAIEVELSLAGKSNKVLSKEMTAKMVTPYQNENVGMGFFIDKHGKAIYFGHGGADEGFRAMLLVHRDRGYGVAVMVNSDNGQIMDEILRSVAKEYQWEDYLEPEREVIPIDAAKLDAYTGRYRVNPDRVLTVTKENGHLFGEPTLSPKVELYPVSQNGFIRTDQNVEYTFASDSVHIKFPGGETVARRMAAGETIPYEQLTAGKTDDAVAAYRKTKKERPDSPAVEEGRLNQIGYTLLRANKIKEAIAVFKLNVELYPQSANVYDSLGEAYAANGEKELAIANYRKSLELDGRNEGAKAMLKKLGQ